MTVDLDPVFAAGVRDVLVDQPRRSSARWWRRSRRVSLAGGLALASIGIAGVATAVWLALPGGQVVTPLSATVTVSGSGNGTLILGTPPPDASAVQFELQCLTPGSFMIGSAGPSVVCGPDDIEARSSVSSGFVGLVAVDHGALAILAGENEEWTISAEYVALDVAPLAINANGETYGSDAYGAHPDLISAVTTDNRHGYIRRSELEAAMGPEPTSPTEAIEMQEARQPGSTYIPVYASDGITVLGVFEISH